VSQFLESDAELYAKA